jgi:FtsX-like permease family
MRPSHDLRCVTRSHATRLYIDRMTVLQRWRRIAAPAGVALARLRSRPGRNVLLLVGIAVAAGMLVAVLGGTVIARDLSLQRLVRELPADQRSFRVDLAGVPAFSRALRPDDVARRALTELTNAKPIRVVAFRDVWLDGEFIRLSGIDGHGDRIRLVSGRLPSRCDAEVCEVLQVGGGGRRELDETGIHLLRVGMGELRETERFGTVFTNLRQQRAQGSYPKSTLLLAPSADVLERLPSVELLLRLASWVVPLEGRDVHEWQIEDVLRRESRAQAILDAADPTFILAGPDFALIDAKTRGDAYGERMALIGGSVAVALFGFALVAAAGLRRGIGGERRRLAQRGATRGQIFVATLTEVGVIAGLGWLLGIVAGAVVIGAVASAKGLPAGETLRHGLLTSDAALVLGCGFVLAVVVLLAVVSGEEREGRRSRIRLLDVVVLGAVLAVVVGISRGELDTESGSSGDTTFLLLLPALICIAGGLVAARILGPLMVLGERLTRRGSIAVRLALLALARSPARTAAAGAFLVVTIALIVFAAAYSATLERGAREEAAFAAPLDVTLASGSSLVEPLDAAPLSAYERLGHGVRAYPVLRTTANAVGAGTSVESPTVLGIPSDAFARMPWRSDYADRSRSTLVADVEPDRAVSLRGVRLPAGAAEARLRVSVRGEPLLFSLVVRDGRGRLGRVRLGVPDPGGSVLAAPLPARVRDVVALEMSLTSAGRAWLLHLVHEGRLIRARSGIASVGPLVASIGRRERVVTDWRGWVARGRGATLEPRKAAATRVAYAFEDDVDLHLRRRQATDDTPVPVIASPPVAAAAGSDGHLTLDFYSTQVPGRVVGVAQRFPSIGESEEFVVADEGALATALDADAPGTGTPGELWLSVPKAETQDVGRALSRVPFSQLEPTWQRQLYQTAHGDPLARGVSTVLGAAALVALVLAFAGLWVTVLSDLRDERDTFFDLEVQGAGPQTLRTHLRIRALVLLGFGLLGGAILGFVLSRLVVSLVQVTGVATDPFPPLVLDAGFDTVAAALLLLVVASLIAVELTVRGAFRAASPERTSWSFE